MRNKMVLNLNGWRVGHGEKWLGVRNHELRELSELGLGEMRWRWEVEVERNKERLGFPKRSVLSCIDLIGLGATATEGEARHADEEEETRGRLRDGLPRCSSTSGVLTPAESDLVNAIEGESARLGDGIHRARRIGVDVAISIVVERDDRRIDIADSIIGIVVETVVISAGEVPRVGRVDDSATAEIERTGPRLRIATGGEHRIDGRRVGERRVLFGRETGEQVGRRLSANRRAGAAGELRTRTAVVDRTSRPVSCCRIREGRRQGDRRNNHEFLHFLFSFVVVFTLGARPLAGHPVNRLLGGRERDLDTRIVTRCSVIATDIHQEAIVRLNEVVLHRIRALLVVAGQVPAGLRRIV